MRALNRFQVVLLTVGPVSLCLWLLWVLSQISYSIQVNKEYYIASGSPMVVRQSRSGGYNYRLEGVIAYADLKGVAVAARSADGYLIGRPFREPEKYSSEAVWLAACKEIEPGFTGQLKRASWFDRIAHSVVLGALVAWLFVLGIVICRKKAR